MFGKRSTSLKSFEARMDEAYGMDISTKAARRRAKFHFLVFDHGVLRTFWTNLFEIRPGVWRSNQPSPKRFKRYRDMGITTILNLRGETGRSPYLLEEEACRKVGLTFITCKLSARKLPPTDRLLDLLDAFETVDKPFLMHCKSGADRAGLASALYLMHIEGTSVEEAKKQLSFKYLHIKSSKTGVLDYMIDAYAADNEKNPMTIRMWIASCYNSKKLQKSFSQGHRFS